MACLQEPDRRFGPSEFSSPLELPARSRFHSNGNSQEKTVSTIENEEPNEEDRMPSCSERLGVMPKVWNTVAKETSPVQNCAGPCFWQRQPEATAGSIPCPHLSL